MLTKIKFFFLAVLLLNFCLTGCRQNTTAEYQTSDEAIPSPPGLQASWEILNTEDINVGLRGLCTISEKVVWASGGGGTVVRSIDGGQTWEKCVIPNSQELGFRDIHAFNENTAIVISAGLPAKIFKTVDGGKNWTETYSNDTEGVFFDAMDFWDQQNGIAFSDPIDGRLFIIRTGDGGNSWEEMPMENRPEIIKDEAGFAASGTCLTVEGEKNVWIGSGGAKARVFHSADRGNSWTVAETGILSGNASSGIFSLAFNDALSGIAVGGNYQVDSISTSNAALTSDGGKSWQIIEKNQPNGFKSCVAYFGNNSNQLVALGTSGSDYSLDGGLTWHFMDSSAYNVVSFSKDGSAGFAAGPKGRIAKFIVNETTQ